MQGDLSESEVHSLYTNPSIKCYVTTTHGEGYGLPIFEAAYSGLPIVATDWSGHLDFLWGMIAEGKSKKKKRKIKRKAVINVRPADFFLCGVSNTFILILIKVSQQLKLL